MNTQSEKICLVVIFNHRYDMNIDKIRFIYEKKFSRIMFLVPFYDGRYSDVIPVYECSYQFPGFLIQAYDRLINVGADYYFFIGDDLILSPYINENNVLEELKMKGRILFTTDIYKLNSKGKFAWEHSRFSSVPFFREERTRWKESIPDYESALKKFYDFWGEEYKAEYDKNFFESAIFLNDLHHKYEEITYFLQRNQNSFKIPYPMAGGYSDIFMIKQEKLFSIARLCGIFSAMNMFAEIAFPTSVVLSVERKDVVLLEETEYSCIVKWDEERKEIEEKYHNQFNLLYQNWDKKNLYIHPVKLSKWIV